MSDNQGDNLDMNEDGKVTQVEEQIVEDKWKNRRRMAWIAMYSMVIFTVVLLLPFVDIERIKVLDNVFGMYYLAMASIVGAYMGFSTWASK